jgi:eukaryotic-like serine/threonine-protein kinase
MSTSQARTARQTAGDTRRTARAPAAALPPVLGRYQLHQRLGAGAFGTVWAARDERLDRDVAVKILPRARIVGGRFEREARAAARLSHPGIVTLYEATVDDEGAYLVSELVRGSTFDEMLAAGLLSDQDIVAIGIALCDALEHAHAAGVVHRDVKPSNVLVPEHPVTSAQVAKLTDFGVARVVGGDALTLTGDVIGTLAYMAPEQAEGLEAGAGADLYSLALVLYEALTGVNPVRASTAAQRARRLGAHLPPLRRQRRDLPRELGQGIDMALRPRPRERGRILDLRRALIAAQDHVADEPGVVGEPWSSGLKRTPPTPKPPSQHQARFEDAADSDDRDYSDDRHQRPDRDYPDHRDHTYQERREARRADLQDAADEDVARRYVAPTWPDRGLAAVAAAAAGAWLASQVLTTGLIPPAAAALLAGGLVLALPRLGWLTLTAAACASTILQGHAGFGVLVLVALAIPVLLLIPRPTSWPLAAAAPALGLIGLAGAWPALAARAGTVWRRAALGAVGWIWLLVAAPIADRVLYLPQPPGTQPPAHWSGSVSGAIHHVLTPALSSGALAPVVVWALAAAVLPWLVLGRSLALDFVRVVIWAAVLVSATAASIAAVHSSNAVHAAPSAVIGGIVAGVVVLAPAWFGTVAQGLRLARHSGGSGGQFP